MPHKTSYPHFDGKPSSVKKRKEEKAMFEDNFECLISKLNILYENVKLNSSVTAFPL